MQVCRLADYFAIISYEYIYEEGSQQGIFSGKEETFPKQNWLDFPLPLGLENVCLPTSRCYTTEPKKPSFYVCTLTDEKGNYQYACCLLTQQKVEAKKSGENLVDDSLYHSKDTLLQPKIYVILSRIPNFDFFRNFLNHIYKGLCEYSESVENMISVVLADIPVHFGRKDPITIPHGLGDFSFVVTKWFSLPLTGKRIYTLMANVGTISNILEIFVNILNDKRIIFVSESLNRLSDACYALRCMIYPMNYSYPYIPILPEMALTILESPTPYIVGVHSSLADRIEDIEDVCIIDLDDGKLVTHQQTSNNPIPDPYYSRLKYMLEVTWNPLIEYADDALQEGVPPLSTPKSLDLKLRACFMRFFIDILYGYRSCLQLIRFYESPLVTFHKTAFLGIREMDDSKLMHDLVSSPMFQSFINDRGIPYRNMDLFDSLVTKFDSVSKNVPLNKAGLQKDLNTIYCELVENEMDGFSSSVASLVTSPHFGATVKEVKKINSLVLDKEISEKVDTNISQTSINYRISTTKQNVPEKCSLRIFEERKQANAGNIEVLKRSLDLIFEGKLSDARRIMSQVELSLNTTSTRVTLCQMLWTNLQPINKATMNPQQFDLVLKLINCALKYEGSEDEHGIAYAMLYLGNIYCRKLSGGEVQFAYTCLQNHAVWNNQRFWEIAFFHDVHQQLRRLYISKQVEMDVSMNESMTNSLKNDAGCPFSIQNCVDTWTLFEKPTAMEVIATRLKQNLKLSDEDIKQLKLEEEAIIYGQAKHYINLMTYMKVPLDASRLIRVNIQHLERQGGDNHDDQSNLNEGKENGYIETSNAESIGKETVRWISSMIDRICAVASLPQLSIKRLEKDIPAFVALHMDNLEQVYNESRRLSAKILKPILCAGEKIVFEAVRCYLLNDNKYVKSKSTSDKSTYPLPAEGAVFLTNYRLIFKGKSCNPLCCEKVIFHSIPVMSLIKDKLILTQDVVNEALAFNIAPQVANKLHDGVCFISVNFDLMRLAFDEDVQIDVITFFVATVSAQRWNSQASNSLFAFQAITPYLIEDPNKINKKSKYEGIKGFQKTLVKGTLKLTGMKKKKLLSGPNSPSKYSKGSLNKAGLMLDGTSIVGTLNRNLPSNDYLDFTNLSSNSLAPIFDMAYNGILYHYLADYERLFYNDHKLAPRYHISFVNNQYDLIKSYPAFILLPITISENVLPKICKAFRNNRFPVITWKNERGAYIARGSEFMNLTVASKLKKQSNKLSKVVQMKSKTLDGAHSKLQLDILEDDEESRHSDQSNATFASSNFSTSSDIFSEYMVALIKLAPLSETSQMLNASSFTSLTSDELSRNSVNSANHTSLAIKSPESIRRNGTSTTSFATNLLRTLGGRSNSKLTDSKKRASTLLDNGTTNHYANYSTPTRQKTSKTNGYEEEGVSLQSKYVLYIFGEKSQAKSIKLDRQCGFVPISYPTTHNVKLCFKRFLKLITQGNIIHNNDNTLVPTPNINVQNGVLIQHSSTVAEIYDSEWIASILNLLTLSSTIGNLIESQNASIALCIEDGSDATCQISSLTQLLLDPFYRTFAGFQILIEKEWLSFGHRFSYRLNHSTDSRSSGIAPMFTMFLDVVNQLCRQFPTAFEMNDFYLRFLAYHSTSSYYVNFLLNSEFERLALEDKVPNDKLEDEFYTRSIWKEIDMIRSKSTYFLNSQYLPTLDKVLNPAIGPENITIWSFYAEDYLIHGHQYDIQLSQKEMNEVEEDRV
uniref:UDENN domain-containing protein n=1 Tax=Rhabditophanes sp. KR3021 TaxID=114890 RepID=A0AC35U8W4_9BILA